MQKERYEYIQARIVCGKLIWKHKMVGIDRRWSERHEEDVTGWTDKQIVDLTCSMLSVDDDQRDVVEVLWY